MKHLLMILALLVSTAGIVTSLIREEVRCYLGLPSHSCQTSQENKLLSPKTLPNPASLVKSTLDKANPSEPETTPPLVEPLFPKKEETSEISDKIEPKTALQPQENPENPSDSWIQPLSEPQGIPIPVEPYSPPENFSEAIPIPVEPASP